MLRGDPVSATADAIDEAKTYARIDGDAHDATIASLLAGAIERCEKITGRTLIRRGFTVTVLPSRDWRKLEARPVQAIGSVRSIAPDGTTTLLDVNMYEIDIDADGEGRVRFLSPVATRRAEVSFVAGHGGWGTIDASLRRGIVGLVAHQFANRDADDGREVPPEVAALWRTARRVRLI